MYVNSGIAFALKLVFTPSNNVTKLYFLIFDHSSQHDHMGLLRYTWAYFTLFLSFLFGGPESGFQL